MKVRVLYLVMCIIWINCHQRTDKEIGKIQNLPDFKFLTIDSSEIINSRDISSGRATVFIYFDPGCEICQQEITAIKNNMKMFNKIQFYLLTAASFKDIRSFNKFYNLDSFKNIIVGRDYEYSFYNKFKPSSIPHIVIYDKDKYLVKVYNSETRIESIIHATNPGM